MEGRNKAALVLAVDGILFANMLSMISLQQKGLGFAMLIVVLVLAALGGVATYVTVKGRK